MKKWISILIAGLLSIGLLTACSNNSDMNTGGSNNTANKSKQKNNNNNDKNEKKFNAGVSKTFLGMNVNIADVKISENRVEIAMNIQNTSPDQLSFYPDQGNIVIGDMQLDANLIGGSGDVSGDINPGVKKDGVVIFDVPEGKKLDVKNIKNIDFHMGQVFDNKTMDSVDDAVISIPVPSS